MLIDFHVHAFADQIAERAVTKLMGVAKIDAETNGTIAETRERLRSWGVDRAVLLPVATKPSQQRTINDWAKAAEDALFVSFGSIHPDAADRLEELAYIKQIGLHGVKLHPDYQAFFAAEEKMFPIYETCAALGLPIVFHAGFDPLSPEVVHGKPEDFAKIAEQFPALTIILAHLGGQLCWDAVEQHIVGRRNVYLDTAYTSRVLSDEQFLRIIRTHGADRILFASDCPWDNAQTIYNRLRALGLTEVEQSQIFYQNAERLLGAEG